MDSQNKEINQKVLKVLSLENVTVMLLEDDELYAEHAKDGTLGFIWRSGGERVFVQLIPKTLVIEKSKNILKSMMK